DRHADEPGPSRRRRSGPARGGSRAAAGRDPGRPVAAGEISRSLPRRAPRRHRAQARGPGDHAGGAGTAAADQGRGPDGRARGEPQGAAQARRRTRARPPGSRRWPQADVPEARIVTSAARVLELDDRRLLLNHLDEVLWPDVGVTKGDLIDYYLDV